MYECENTCEKNKIKEKHNKKIKTNVPEKQTHRLQYNYRMHTLHRHTHTQYEWAGGEKETVRRARTKELDSNRMSVRFPVI